MEEAMENMRWRGTMEFEMQKHFKQLDLGLPGLKYKVDAIWVPMDKYKARLVAKHYVQMKGENFEEYFCFD